MTTRRRIGIALAATVVVFVAVGIGRSAWRRAQEPKYEGRTATEWLDYLVDQTPIHGSVPELPLKETSVALAALGASAEVSIFRESTFTDPPHPYLERLRLWAEDKPLLKSIGILRSQNRRAWAVSDYLASNNLGFHWTNIEEPLREALESNDSNHLWFALLNLAYLRDGWSNAIPILTAELTNASPQHPIVVLSTLRHFGTNAISAMPILLKLITTGMTQDRKGKMLFLKTADVLGRIGPSASEALPMLGRRLDTAADVFEQFRLASAILHIDANHPSAQRIVRDLIQTDPLVTLAKLKLWDEMHSNGLPNPFLVKMAVSQLTDSADSSDTEAASLLLRHDPYQARKAMHSWLDTDDTYLETQIVALLLEHDPRDEIAIHHLVARIQSDGFMTRQFKTPYVTPLSHCLPDSSGVVQLLKSIQPAPDDEALRQTIRETLRHIELNGKLQELRERDDARQR